MIEESGVRPKEICRLAGIGSTTLAGYLRAYQSGGLEALKAVQFYRPESELQAYRGTLEAYFREHPPATAKEATAKIEQLTGVRRRPDRVRHFLKGLGMDWRKVGMVPAKTDLERQEAFKKNALEPRLAEAKAGRRAVFFVDAAHFVLAPFQGMLWCFARVFMPAPAGRQRFNVLGALNAITHELVTVTNDTYINADSVCELLRRLVALRLGMLITLVLDNARYQKCHVVQTLAETLQIELL